MPWVSDKQRRWAHAQLKNLKPEMSAKEVKHFDEASKGKDLPESAPKKKEHKKHASFTEGVFEKLAELLNAGS